MAAGMNVARAIYFNKSLPMEHFYTSNLCTQHVAVYGASSRVMHLMMIAFEDTAGIPNTTLEICLWHAAGMYISGFVYINKSIPMEHFCTSSLSTSYVAVLRKL